MIIGSIDSIEIKLLILLETQKLIDTLDSNESIYSIETIDSIKSIETIELIDSIDFRDFFDSSDFRNFFDSSWLRLIKYTNQLLRAPLDGYLHPKNALSCAVVGKSELAVN